MTSAEAMELALMCFGNTISLSALLLSIVTAYCIIMFTAGSRLATVEYGMLTFGYLLWLSFSTIATYQQMVMGLHFRETSGEIVHMPYAPYWIVAIAITVITASLWYGWRVRRA